MPISEATSEIAAELRLDKLLSRHHQIRQDREMTLKILPNIEYFSYSCLQLFLDL